MDQSKTPPDLKALRVGDIVTWRSPMFGLLKGRVFLLPSGDDFIDRATSDQRKAAPRTDGLDHGDRATR